MLLLGFILMIQLEPTYITDDFNITVTVYYFAPAPSQVPGPVDQSLPQKVQSLGSLKAAVCCCGQFVLRH